MRRLQRWPESLLLARQRLLERPHLPVAMWLAVTGLAALLSGGLVPASISLALPGWLVMMWTASIAFGGVLATVGCLASHTRTESIGLGMLVYGILLYGVILSVVAWPASFAVAMVCVALASMCGIRMRVLALSRRVEQRFGGRDR